MRLFKLKEVIKTLDFCVVTQTKQTNNSIVMTVTVNDIDDAFLKPIPNAYNL